MRGRNARLPGFAASSDGQEIVALHLLGYPLATTQDELTDQQRAFLLEALPPVIARMNGQGMSQTNSPSLQGPARDLFQQMRDRQHGKRP